MNRLLTALLLFFTVTMQAQTRESYDVFIPISKYISTGDADALSAWFDDNLEISVENRLNTASRSQSKQIIKAFFNRYSPSGFEIRHKAGRATMMHALGRLKAGGESFDVTIFVNLKDDRYLIQQLTIEKAP